MEVRNIYKCFISSPSDCQKERQLCQEVIDKINTGLAKHLGINFETLMWEKDILPDMGKNGQEIIDQYAKLSNFDIYIGIMKNRFGTPTTIAGSGTEHELNLALQQKAASIDSLPSIIFFFGKENVDPENFDFDQFDKVRSFKSRVKNMGIYVEFTDSTSFETKLIEKLELFISHHSPLDKACEKIKEVDLVLKKLEDDLNESLKTYNEKSPVWIDPIISSKREIPENPTKNDENRVELKTIIDNPSNIVIKAPSEFGLSSLAHYLKLEAWKVGKTFLYIDAKLTKKHKVVKDILKEVETYYFKSKNSIDCILLDSITFEEIGIMQMIKNICDEFPETPLIIFNTLDNNFFLKSNEDDRVEIRRSFTSYYLLPLSQNEVRKIVCGYSELKCLEEDKDVILAKVTKDLECLNMHRTAKNCISILRASTKIGTLFNPVNRTKLLETILNTIFEEYEVPTYQDKKPDVKDCNFVLGYFCELLVIRNDFEFSEDFFKSKLKEFCITNFISLDLNYLFTVLNDNSIFVKRNITYFFKNSYWVFYFIAQRMNMNKEFLEVINKNKKYIDYPEIIEFYTGIDRNKEDSLKILKDDLNETLGIVRMKVKIPDNINPYRSIKWTPDIRTLEIEEEKISGDVISSGLPDEVKDKYEDRNYNQLRPYNQVINSVIRDYSFSVLMQQISASSRALRNSDFVDAAIKKGLLDMIIQSWNELNKLLIVMTPLLAEKGDIAFEGTRFYLCEEDFKMYTNEEEKRLAVLLAIPSNIVKFFKDDLFSTKMGPLLLDKAEHEPNSLLKHEMILLLINERPEGWYKIIDNYIIKLDTDSFFLNDTLFTLNHNLEYNASETKDRSSLIQLASKCRAKYFFKKNNPDPGLINRYKRLNDGARF